MADGLPTSVDPTGCVDVSSRAWLFGAAAEDADAALDTWTTLSIA